MADLTEMNSSEIELDKIEPQGVKSPQPPKKKELTFTKSEKVFSLIAFILTYCFIHFALFNTTGFITTGLFICITTASIIMLRKKNFSISGVNKKIAVLLYLFSTVFSITDNGFIKFLDLVFLFILNSYFIYSVSAQKNQLERFLPFALKKSIFEYPVSQFDAETKALKSFKSDPENTGKLRPIILGLIAAVPLTLVVLLLLMSADENISKMFSEIAKFIIPYNFRFIVFKLAIAIPCSCYFFGMIYSNTNRKELNILDEKACMEKMQSYRNIQNAAIYSFVTPICFLYVIFIISQTSYLLSAFLGNLPDGYSYSEYARKGFFELAVITVIILGVIVFMNLTAKNGGQKKPLALKIYTTVLCGFTLFIIAASMSKMVLYISEYGLTQLRVYTSWFMILCGIMFIFIIIKQFKPNMNISQWCTAAFTVMFAILCFSRPDSIIAKYNIEQYNAGNLSRLDKYELLEMSDDSILTALKNGVVTEDEAERNARKGEYGRLNISSLLLESYLES